MSSIILHLPISCAQCLVKPRPYNAVTVGWLRGTVVERRSGTGKLSLSYTWLAADGWPLMWVNRPLQVSELGQLSLSSFQGR